MRLAAMAQQGRLRPHNAAVLTDRNQIFWIAILAAAAASLVLRREGLTADVSWLLTMCERMLAGEKAYVDIFETTPPVPTLLYMPAAAISRLTGLNSAALLVAWTYGAALYALYLTWRILPAAAPGAFDQRSALIAASAFGLFVLANDAFAQREYFAVAFALPLLAVLIRYHATGEWTAVGFRLQAALLAGLTVAIKPPLFVLPGALAAAYFLWSTRNLRSLYISGLIAAALLGVLITVASLAAFPEYLENLTPYMRDIYVPLHMPLTDLLRTPQFWAIATSLAASLLYLRKTGADNSLAIIIVAASGFAIAFVSQNKFYWYHSFPAIFLLGVSAFCLLAQQLAPLLAARSTSVAALARLNQHLWIAVGLCALSFTANSDRSPEIEDLSWSIDRNGLTASAISTDIAFSFPLARKIDAVWVDRIHGQWVAGYARHLLKNNNISTEKRALYQQYFDNELDRVAALIAAREPALLFVDLRSPWLQDRLLERDPGLLQPYETIAEEGDYRILLRRNAVTSPAAPQ